MPKKSKRDKQAPNFVVFLVEGESDQIALETPLSELIFEKYPDYEVRFLLQQRLVNNDGEEVEDNEDEDDYIEEDEYTYGGDITTSSFVTPENIVIKIENRFIKPATKAEGLYPKRIAKIIQIVDMDGAFLPESSVIPLAAERASLEKPFYDGENGVIETRNIEAIRERNTRKRKNIEHLLSFSSTGIKIGTRTIPYEIYFFSSNLDHVINNDANLESGKKFYADRFLRTYGLFPERFSRFFSESHVAIGYMGYHESWDEIMQGANSVKQMTNIDYLINRLQED